MILKLVSLGFFVPKVSFDIPHRVKLQVGLAVRLRRRDTSTQSRPVFKIGRSALSTPSGYFVNAFSA
jgi:hypothetical protein